MKKQLLELYTDYLMSSFSYTTATGLSVMSEGKISHAKVTGFLSSEDFTPAGLWELIKPTVREIESASGGEAGVIIIVAFLHELVNNKSNTIITNTKESRCFFIKVSRQKLKEKEGEKYRRIVTSRKLLVESKRGRRNYFVQVKKNYT